MTEKLSDVQIFCGWSGFLNFLTCLGLAIFLYFKNRFGKVNKAFALWSSSVAFWSLGYFMWLFSNEYAHALFWARFLMAGAIVIPSAYLHFALIYLNLDERHRLLIVAGYIFSAIYLLLDLTPFFVYSVEPRYWFQWWPVPGRWYHVYQAYFILVVIYAHFLLFQKAYTTHSEILRKQFKIVAFGTLIAYAGGSTNFFLWYNIPIPPVFNFLVTGYVAFIAYAILHYRLWNLDFIIRKTIIFGGITVSFLFIFFSLTYLLNLVVGTYVGVSSNMIAVITFAIGAILYRPIEGFLVRLTDKFLFQKKYDYRKLLKDASAGISQIKSLRQLLSLVTHFVTMRVRVKSAAVIVHDEQNDYFKLAYLRGYPKEGWLREGHIFNEADPFIDYLTYERQPLDLERVKEWTESSRGPRTPNHESRGTLDAECGTKKYDFQAIKQRMTELQAACCVPSFLSDRLRNVLILGEKKSGDFYTDEDLHVLYTLAQESAIAIENARLYDEAIEKAKELELINDQLNKAQTKLMRALSETETAHKKLQTTQAALIVAEKKATMVGMAQAIGHEVYNPLVPISGRAQHIYMIHVKKYTNLLDKYRNAMADDDVKIFEKTIQETDHYAHSIVNSANRVQGVVHTLTGTLKQSSGEIGPLNLIVFFQSVLNASQFTTGEENLSGCDIRLDVASDLMIMGNRDQLEQVFLNLIKNAYDAMRERQDRIIEIRADADPNDPTMAKVEFADNGPGIPSEILPKIWMHGFTTKVQANKSIGASGQGLGLFVCKHIIEDFHNGTITVTSAVGKGTTFTIGLHLAPEKEKE